MGVVLARFGDWPAAFDAGDFRWAAEVANHAVFAEPDHAEAREVLADTYEQLAYGSENGTWRDFYFAGATELRHGQFGTPTETNAPDVVAALTPDMLFEPSPSRSMGPPPGTRACPSTSSSPMSTSATACDSLTECSPTAPGRNAETQTRPSPRPVARSQR